MKEKGFKSKYLNFKCLIILLLVIVVVGAAVYVAGKLLGLFGVAADTATTVIEDVEEVVTTTVEDLADCATVIASDAVTLLEEAAGCVGYVFTGIISGVSSLFSS